MDSLGRLLLRLIVVPLGALAAVTLAVLIVIVGQWQEFAAAIAAHPEAQQDYVLALFFFGPWIALVLSTSAIIMLTPGAVGIVIAEAFAIRAWWFHVLNGILSAWVGWSLVDRPGEPYRYFDDPKLVIAAGLGAGLAYWLIAGWSAGFYRPVFGRAAAPSQPPAQKP